MLQQQVLMTGSVYLFRFYFRKKSSFLSKKTETKVSWHHLHFRILERMSHHQSPHSMDFTSTETWALGFVWTSQEHFKFVSCKDTLENGNKLSLMHHSLLVQQKPAPGRLTILRMADLSASLRVNASLLVVTGLELWLHSYQPSKHPVQPQQNTDDLIA